MYPSPGPQEFYPQSCEESPAFQNPPILLSPATMLFHLSTLLLVMFLGAIVGTSTSRYEDDDELPALTASDQANDHHWQQFVYDVDNGVNASFACTAAQVNTFWNTGGVRTHLNREPYYEDPHNASKRCEGGHVVSRYLSSLSQANHGPKIRNVVISGFNSDTGLLTVSRYEYRTNAAPWPPRPKTCTLTKTLWNDGGADLGQRLRDLGVTLPPNFPLDGWTSYRLISIPNSEVEQQCKRSLLAHQCRPSTAGSYVVPSYLNPNNFNLCVRVAMVQNNWATCYPAGLNAATGNVGTVCQ